MTPFEILEVQPASSDQEVKDAYLRLVRRFPPEAHPARFRLISDAYAQIDTKTKRLDWALFSRKTVLHSPMDVLSKRFLFWDRKPMGREAFHRFFRQAAGGGP